MENKKLKEAAEAFVKTIGGNNQNGRNQRFAARIAFMAGSCWQQEQNKELIQQRDELLQALHTIIKLSHVENIKHCAKEALSKINP